MFGNQGKDKFWLSLGFTGELDKRVISLSDRKFIILATLEKAMILPVKNKIVLKGIYWVNTECPQYH